MSDEIKPKRLSYSSFMDYSSCSRRWFLRKVKNAPIDSDADVSTEAFDIGKSFHRCLELTNHNLAGFTLQKCAEVCAEFEVTELDDVSMIFAMLIKYKELHEKGGLKVVACELDVSSGLFTGVVDVVMQDSEGKVWITDLKTSGAWYKSMLNTVTSHPQINIYARYIDEILYAVGLKTARFGGCRIRTVIKSRLKKNMKETQGEYIQRMASGIKAFDIAVPASSLNVDRINRAHLETAKKIMSATVEDEAYFSPNFGACMDYNKPCNFYSQCHGRNFTESPKIEVTEV